MWSKECLLAKLSTPYSVSAIAMCRNHPYPVHNRTQTRDTVRSIEKKIGKTHVQSDYRRKIRWYRHPSVHSNTTLDRTEGRTSAVGAAEGRPTAYLRLIGNLVRRTRNSQYETLQTACDLERIARKGLLTGARKRIVATAEGSLV